MHRRKKTTEPLFSIDDRGFNIKAWYVEDTEDSKGDAVVQVRYNGELKRQIIWPAYKIWNIAAHSDDIVDGELSRTDDERGYKIAGWCGVGPIE